MRPDIMVNMFDAHQFTEVLQEAVRHGDREHLENSVSDRMIWVMPSPESQRGKGGVDRRKLLDYVELVQGHRSSRSGTGQRLHRGVVDQPIP
jgi:hypothetical protein